MVEECKFVVCVGEILVVDIIVLGDMVYLVGYGLLGVVISLGSFYLYSVIFVCSLDLLMLVGMCDVLLIIYDDDLILFDVEQGEVIVYFIVQDFLCYCVWQCEVVLEGWCLVKLVNVFLCICDGVEIKLLVNVEFSLDVVMVCVCGVDGVGLYCIEFLFLCYKGLFSEEEQFVVYCDLVMGMGGLLVIICMFDLGVDKVDVVGIVLCGEDNLVFGVCGVWLLLCYLVVFIMQICVILCVVCYGLMCVLVLMIIQLDEIIVVCMLFKLVCQEFKQEGVDLLEKLLLGVMIEVFVVVINVCVLFEYVDFFVIGINDLVQYVLVVDCGNDVLENVYNLFNLVLL